MTTKRGKKNNNPNGEKTDPDRFVEVSDFIDRGRGRGIPYLPTTERPETFGIRASCGAELFSLSRVDEDTSF